MKYRLALALVFSLAAAGCAREDSDPAAAGPGAAPASFDETVAAASDALARAQQRRYAWSRTASLLDEARSAHQDGRTAEALELATEAKLQAELALEQADFERDAWRSRVLPE